MIRVSKREFFNRVNMIVDTFKRKGDAEIVSFRINNIVMTTHSNHSILKGPFLLQNFGFSDCTIDLLPVRGVLSLIIQSRESHQKIIAHPNDLKASPSVLEISHAGINITIQ